MNRDDVKAYIRLFLEEDPEHKDKLQDWINSRQITTEQFVEELAEKSEYNFMYLRYVLPAIADGDYRNFSIKRSYKRVCSNITNNIGSGWRWREKISAMQLFFLS